MKNRFSFSKAPVPRRRFLRRDQHSRYSVKLDSSDLDPRESSSPRSIPAPGGRTTMEENGPAYRVIPAKAGIYCGMGTGLRRCDEDGSLVRQRLFSWEARRSWRFFNTMGVAYSRGSGEQQILSNPI